MVDVGGNTTGLYDGLLARGARCGGRGGGRGGAGGGAEVLMGITLIELHVEAGDLHVNCDCGDGFVTTSSSAGFPGKPGFEGEQTIAARLTKRIYESTNNQTNSKKKRNPNFVFTSSGPNNKS